MPANINPDVLLKQTIKYFDSIPVKVKYIEDQEYSSAMPLHLKNYFNFSYHKLMDGDQVLRQQYLHGSSKAGVPSQGGIKIYKDVYPFQTKYAASYVFSVKSENEIFFHPKVKEENTFAGLLTLKKGIPDTIELYPVYRFQNLDYYYKRVSFVFDGRVLLENTIQIHGAFYYVPFYRYVVRHRMKRYSYNYLDLTWPY